MGDTGNGEMSADERAVTRRRMLQGAVAAGVGATAWAAPHITTFGTAPAYASHACSFASPVTDFVSDCNSTSSPSGPGGCNPPPLPATAVRRYQLNGTVAFGTGGVVTPNGNACTDGVSTVTFTNPVGLRCRIKTLKLFGSNGDCATQTGALQTGAGGSNIIPDLARVPPSNKFWSMNIECVASGGCFPDEVGI